MSTKIGKFIPKRLKRILIKISYLPEKLFFKIYHSGAKGKIFIPDKLFQKMDFWIFNKKRLSFRNPQGYNEKLQWMKYYYRKPEFTDLVDKYEVRKYVEQKVGSGILIPYLGIFTKWDEINFDSLPNEFVIKCTHDSGSVVICRDKANFDYENARAIIENGLNRNQFYLSREWPYKNVKPRIIIEQYLKNRDGSSLVDYKVLCFDGKPLIFDVLLGKNRNEPVCENFYDLDWNLLSVSQGHENTSYEIPKPDDFDLMIDYAKKLSAGFPHIRVDFLKENDKLYFTELTFFNAGARAPFEPESFNLWLGRQLVLPPKTR